ncbi:Cytochrome B561 [Bathymodiolus heckerae thiotrophic gill symbiont]|uniref:cytochrome b n=1 Tax=Bathymodiolus heckerae thiotrophic gill symbiont TaxID=1052212 RepID=UPI0010B625F7|nr:cytochrome b [Bathymodiolus heckerae thiotrophic gill symbiont]SMN12600.1 Cytochrome B561 [Bathymodiolus heckerae thiotrophic gill symbiont]
MIKDSKKKLSPITTTLHWLIAIVLISLIAVGIYMEENEVFFLYPIHKSIGMLLFSVILIRVVWRIKSGWPEPVSQYKKIEQIGARTIHWVLIIGTVMMPISGMLMSGAGGYGLSIFGLELLASNPDELNPGKVIPLSKSLAGLGHTLHELGGNIMIFAITLHIIGAFKHHFIDKDSTLRRMLGRR